MAAYSPKVIHVLDFDKGLEVLGYRTKFHAIDRKKNLRRIAYDLASHMGQQRNTGIDRIVKKVIIYMLETADDKHKKYYSKILDDITNKGLSLKNNHTIENKIPPGAMNVGEEYRRVRSSIRDYMDHFNCPREFFYSNQYRPSSGINEIATSTEGDGPDLDTTHFSVMCSNEHAHKAWNFGYMSAANDQPNMLLKNTKNIGKKSADLMKIYTSKNLYSERHKSENVSSVMVAQVFDSSVTSAESDSDLVELLMACLTTLEASRSTPLLEAGFVLESNNRENWIDSEVNGYPFSLERWLGPIRFSGEAALVNASLPNYHTEVPGSNLQIGAGSEIFFSPQTLVAAPGATALSDFQTSGLNKSEEFNTTDPFRPFLSIKSFEIQDIPGESQASYYQRATLQLTLHDKSKLHEIAQLISPSVFDKISIQMNHGWSHPLSVPLNKLVEVISYNEIPVSSVSKYEDGSKEGEDMVNVIGELIGSMNVSRRYAVLSSTFAVRGSEVDLTLNLMPSGDFIEEEANVANFESGPSYKKISDLVKNVQQKADDFSNIGYKDVNMPGILSGLNTDAVFNLDKKKEKQLREFIKNARSKGVGEDLVNSLTRLLEGGKIQAAKTSRSKAFKKRLSVLKSASRRKKDPFMCNHGYYEKFFNKRSYCTLGHLILGFLGPAVHDSYEECDVIFTFENFNMSAGGSFDRNIAQMPILYTSIEKALAPLYERNSKISISEFLSTVLDKLVNTQTAQAYGVTAPDENTKNAKNLSAFQAAQEATLARIYGYDPKSKNSKDYLEFKLPSVAYKMDSGPTKIPSSDNPGLTESANYSYSKRKTLRFVFTDRQLEAESDVGTFLQAAKNKMGKLAFPTRKENGKMLPNHTGEKGVEIKDMLKKYYNIAFDEIYAASNPFLTQGVEAVSDDSSNFDVNHVKRIIKTVYPTISYGIESSGVFSANIQTMSDDAMFSSAMHDRWNKSADIARNSSTIKLPELPLRVAPSELDLECFGCPFWHIGQQFFIDFGTNTSVDALYAVVSVSHSIQAGSYTTKVKLKELSNAYGVFKSILGEAESAALDVLKLAEEQRAKENPDFPKRIPIHIQDRNPTYQIRGGSAEERAAEHLKTQTELAAQMKEEMKLIKELADEKRGLNKRRKMIHSTKISERSKKRQNEAKKWAAEKRKKAEDDEQFSKDLIRLDNELIQAKKELLDKDPDLFHRVDELLGRIPPTPFVASYKAYIKAYKDPTFALLL